MDDLPRFAAGLLALPGRGRGAQTLAQALCDPLLAAVLWRVLRDEGVVDWPGRAALDGAIATLIGCEAALPMAPPAALRALCGPAHPLLTLAVSGAGDLEQAVFGGEHG